MPTYQYRCNDCQYEFEEFQSMTAPPLDKCPRCGGPAARVISGGAGLLFKGDGFYITDYRSSGYKKDARKDAPASSSDSKPDSKPAPKSDSSPKKSDS
jgi:putative FmdB family regulatory protein